MDYAIRLQALDGYDGKISTLLSSDRFHRTIRIHHTGKKGDNPHYHMLITTDYKQPALRAEFKKHFTLATGNRHLSIKKWDGNIKALAYLFHEGTQPTDIKGFLDEELELAREINTQVKEVIKKNAPAQVVEEATEYFRGKTPGAIQIFSYIYDRYKNSGDWLPNKYQFERYIHRIQANLAETPAEIYDHKNYLLRHYGFVSDNVGLAEFKY